MSNNHKQTLSIFVYEEIRILDVFASGLKQIKKFVQNIIAKTIFRNVLHLIFATLDNHVSPPCNKENHIINAEYCMAI